LLLAKQAAEWLQLLALVRAAAAAGRIEAEAEVAGRVADLKNFNFSKKNF
jgi:hypothetical protein